MCIMCTKMPISLIIARKRTVSPSLLSVSSQHTSWPMAQKAAVLHKVHCCSPTVTPVSAAWCSLYLKLLLTAQTISKVGDCDGFVAAAVLMAFKFLHGKSMACLECGLHQQGLQACRDPTSSRHHLFALGARKLPGKVSQTTKLMPQAWEGPPLQSC